MLAPIFCELVTFTGKISLHINVLPSTEVSNMVLRSIPFNTFLKSRMRVNISHEMMLISEYSQSTI